MHPGTGGSAPHPAGHHDAGDGRAERPGRPPGAQPCPRHPPHRQERGHGQGPGPEPGGGRLCDQALPAPGGLRPGPQPAAALSQLSGRCRPEGDPFRRGHPPGRPHQGGAAGRGAGGPHSQGIRDTQAPHVLPRHGVLPQGDLRRRVEGKAPGVGQHRGGPHPPPAGKAGDRPGGPPAYQGGLRPGL